MSKHTVERLYAAFANLDGAGMQACYAENARFDDAMFTLAGRRQIGGMWRMRCEEARLRGIGQWRLELGEMRASAVQARVHWEAHSLVGPARRKVRQRVDAKFDFDDAGLIVRHRDVYSFWPWARQALGAQGLLLGWTSWLHHRVQHQAGQQLRRYMEKNR